MYSPNPYSSITSFQQPKHFSKTHRTRKLAFPSLLVMLGVVFLLVTIVFGVILHQKGRAPKKAAAFPVAFSIETGQSITSVGDMLKDMDLIRSRRLFLAMWKLQFPEEVIQAGQYLVQQPYSLRSFIQEIVLPGASVPQVTLTFVEGGTSEEFTEVIVEAFPDFDPQTVFDAVNEKEGQLFPDTYFFKEQAALEDIVDRLEDEFTENTQEVFSTTTTELEPEELVILASIIEKEANSSLEESKVVSGILHNRLKRGMALQVDAPFLYLLGKTSAELTYEDLAIDSPYNTYRYPGLPPTPIGNPGLVALRAAAQPASTDYLFYLHAPDGTIHYATTHDGHVANKRRYLK